MAKAKVNVNQVKGVASKAGAPIPPKPRIQSPDQLKKQAEQRAKARVKTLIRGAIMVLGLVIIAGAVYLFKFYGRMPKDALKNAIEYAYEDNTIKFKQYFTTDSIKIVENGNDTNTAPWEHLMDVITPTGEKPKILKENIEEKNNQKIAQVTIRLEGDERTIHMRQEDGKWRINLNVAIDPRHLTLPEDIPADYIDNFTLNDELEAWWETPPETEENSSFFSKIFGKKGGSKAKSSGSSSSFKLF